MKHQLDFEKPITELQNKLDDLRAHPEKHSLGISFEEEIQIIEKKLEETRRQIFLNLNAWQRVQLARHPKRPYSLDYFQKTFSDFQELHGDRLFAEDRAMVCGFARLGGHHVLVIGTQKGRDTKENILRNFGSAHPEGYRKALRLMRLANKFGLPIITLIDTAGAYPGVAAEERHIAEAIAVNLREMTLLEVPIIATVIGEGGSGGALGIGVADRVLILENAYYSVISPEGCAAILWKDRANAAKAAAALRITAKDLLELKLVDEIVPEPLGGAHINATEIAASLKSCLIKHLEEVLAMPVAERLKTRYAKFRAHGHFTEEAGDAGNMKSAKVAKAIAASILMLYPFIFQSIFKDRIWGGREFERLYAKKIPAGQIGEAWEISDRPGDASVIANGPLAGKDLRWLMENHAAEILGGAKPAAAGCFPLLCKILDAREKLSLQVHPPASKAAELKGEPKTEMWFIADAAPGASLYVGLKSGVTRAEFERKIADGSVADCFHRIPVQAGDTMFLPSGRVHAIGDGLVIFEIQQNSDTTYRVFDWNRVGLDGKPRELHVTQSLASIDFNDFEPKLVASKYNQGPSFKFRYLVQDPLFEVQEIVFENIGSLVLAGQYLRIIAVVKGAATVIGGENNTSVELQPGQFCLIPACLKGVEIKAQPQTSFLCVEAN